jgi:hypothetical protein
MEPHRSLDVFRVRENGTGRSLFGCARLTSVLCEERDRLNSIYLAAAAKVFDARKVVAKMTPVEWREAPKRHGRSAKLR